MEEYKFYCDKCEYGTNIKCSYDKHLGTILHKTGKKGKRQKSIVYNCDKCDYTTTNNNNFLTHKLNNHSTKEERKKEFKYFCDLCDMGVFTESCYNKHLETKGHKRAVQNNKN
jgi:hypothetical protein